MRASDLARCAAIVSVLLLLGGCGAMQVANNSSEVGNAIASGKAVLISNASTFSPESDASEWVELPGKYRPALTYWIHRSTGKTLVLGAWDSADGRGKVLTDAHFYYVVEPGFYDFAGYVEKTRFGSLNELQTTTGGIKSNVGFVNFSAAPLRTFYTYDAWVPSSYDGSTFDGNTLTHWYAPGYWQERGATRPDEGIFIDMRGLIPNSENGKPNIGSFLVEPGQIVVAPDFKMEFTHSACDKPKEGQWVCPLTSLTLSAPFTDQHLEVQALMRQFRYDANLVAKVGSTFILPGEFFKNFKMEASDYRTAQGQPYGRFRVTQLTMPQTPARPKPGQ